MPSASLHPAVPAVLALVTGAAALALAALARIYRRTLVRGLRSRHPAAWEALERPGEGDVPWSPASRRLGAFLRAGGHYRLNDADLAAAGRLHLVTGRSGAGLLLLLVLALGAWLLARPRSSGGAAASAAAERVRAASA